MTDVGYMARAQKYLVNTFGAGIRYVGYTSDIGESFRPVVSPAIVRAGYGISWAYLIGDVGYEGYKAKMVRGDDNTTVGLLCVRRSVFQALATMALPAFTIHSVVKYTGRMMHNVKNPKVKGWGPTLLGLATVPALPYLFDHPVEYAIDSVFDRIETAAFGAPRSRATHDPVAAAHVQADKVKKGL